MGLVDKTIWYIESHFESEIRLEEVARLAGVSRFHLLKAFGYATGYSVMRYVRHRRLTQAARALADGESDILGLAVKVGYGSHEAFTRAFREQFGRTPSQVREQRSVDGLDLMEAIRMNGRVAGRLEAPRIVEGKALLVAGLQRSYTHETSAGIPAQWQNFGPHIGHVPGQVNGCAYGVIYNGDDEGNYDYLCGVEVADFSRLPAEMTRLRIPEQRYAVFDHPGHVSAIRATCSAIWSEWLPGSGHQMADGPVLELYRETFDPEKGTGDIQVWVPLE
jgi:AraC family transcriptional regulator